MWREKLSVRELTVKTIKDEAGDSATHQVVAAGEFTTLGGDANEAITITDLLATDLCHVTLHTKGASPQTILTAVCAAGQINVVMSADPSTDHVLTYSVLRAFG